MPQSKNAEGQQCKYILLHRLYEKDFSNSGNFKPPLPYSKPENLFNTEKVRNNETRRERLKSALYLRIKKRERLFFEKKLEIFEVFFFQKMSHSAEKCKRGALGFININSAAKYQKTRKGGSFQTLKNFRKKSLNAEKNRKALKKNP